MVISIIGFIVAASVLAFNNARMKSRDVRRVAHIKQIQTALGLYYNDANGYPSTVEAPLPAGQCLSSISGFAATCAGTTYMSIVPTAPLPNDGTCTTAQNTYTYAMGAGGTTYTLSYCLGETTGGIKAGPHTATPAGLITYNISIYEKSGTFTCNSDDTAIAYKTTAATCGSSCCKKCTTGFHDWSPMGNYQETCVARDDWWLCLSCKSSYNCRATPYVRCKSVKY